MTIRRGACGLSVLLALTAAGVTIAHAAPGLKPGRYKIDTAHTYAHFAIDHMGLSTLRGRMDVRKGTIRIGDDPSHSAIDVTFDPASVDTGDDARDQHLRDMEGFFNVKKYPSLTFKSTSVRFGDDDGDSEATVQGRLTLHGVTRPVTLQVDDIACKVNPLEKTRYTCGFDAATEIKRSDFGMDAFPKLVGDKVELSFEVEANKPVNAKD